MTYQADDIEQFMDECIGNAHFDDALGAVALAARKKSGGRFDMKNVFSILSQQAAMAAMYLDGYMKGKNPEVLSLAAEAIAAMQETIASTKSRMGWR